ncbi:MAG TPA: hypothetical protein VHZ75_01425 [Solirubrobacteraceae bacterium]|jgi:hypothetical protein|nr:hypothetical protein [Solirubrobacteraceae bacterium]
MRAARASRPAQAAWAIAARWVVEAAVPAGGPVAAVAAVAARSETVAVVAAARTHGRDASAVLVARGGRAR